MMQRMMSLMILYAYYVTVRVFSHIVNCHLEEALNYKFKNKRANKSVSSVDRVAQWLQRVRSI